MTRARALLVAIGLLGAGCVGFGPLHGAHAVARPFREEPVLPSDVRDTTFHRWPNAALVPWNLAATASLNLLPTLILLEDESSDPEDWFVRLDAICWDLHSGCGHASGEGWVHGEPGRRND